MEPRGFHRKLAANFSTDVAGYSRMMEDDEAATVLTLESYKLIISAFVQQHRGREVASRVWGLRRQKAMDSRGLPPR
jgi:hypothetical protein